MGIKGKGKDSIGSLGKGTRGALVRMFVASFPVSGTGSNRPISRIKDPIAELNGAKIFGMESGQ